MLHKRKRILMASSLGMVVVLVSFLTLTIISRAFATMEHLGYSVFWDEPGEVAVSIIATDDMEIYAIGGNFALHETTDGDTYFDLEHMTYNTKFGEVGEVVENEVGSSVGQFSWIAGSGESDTVTVSEGERLWTGYYSVPTHEVSDPADPPVADPRMYPDMPVGTYSIELSNLQLSLAGDGGDFNGNLVAEVSVDANKPSQDFYFVGGYTEKEWGDDNFTNTLERYSGDGAITYSSSDTSVATVDPTTGEVTIVGIGEVEIRATAAETDTYMETTNYYTLLVDKKDVHVTAAEIEDKVYDGDVSATIVPDSVTLDVADLTYTSEAYFDDENVGEDKTVRVYVTLTGDSADYYEIIGRSYPATATITPFVVKPENLLIPDDPIIYSGSANEPDVIVMVQLDGATDTTLIPGTDFTVAYDEDTITAGVKNISVTTSGNYTDDGDLVGTYTVSPYTLTGSNISLQYTTVRVDGTAKTPWVKVFIGDFEVDPNEFTVGYSDDNVNPGPVTVTVTAKADTNIAGSATATFEIIDKEVLNITGIANQSVAYTGSPVSLAGTLAVGANTDGITVADLTTKWYASDGVTEIPQPTDAGDYKVVYSYDGANYVGSLEVSFEITKLVSPQPAEMSADFRVAVGTALSAIPGIRTTGFLWSNPAGTVTAGNLTYAATYTYNDDTTNYTTLNLNVPVYGLAEINVSAVVNGAGGTVTFPATALEGDTITFTFSPATGYEIDKVTLNSLNVTSSVTDNKLEIVAGTTDVDLVVKYHRIYTVTEGDGASVVAKKGQEATFVIDADLALFTAGGKVYVDSMLINSGYYRYASGSTIITLTEEFIATLPSGTHTLSVVFADGGVARASFTVSNPAKDAEIAVPDTGFFTGATNARIVGITAIVLGLTGLSVVLKKRFARTKVDFDKK